MNAGRRFWVALSALAMMALAPVGAAWAQVKVASAEPASTTQGTTGLDVTISGSGFDASAAVRFLVSGTTNQDQIDVTSVVYVNSKKLIARINAKDTATVALYDIEVTLSTGRKGKGTTLFKVDGKGEVLDPCIGATAAFVVDKDSANGPKTLYLANASATCLRPLYTFNSVFMHGAAFRVVNRDGIDEGRVVVSDGGDDLLFIRFPIGSDMQVDPSSIVVKRIFDPQLPGFVDNRFFDLAVDGRRFVYVTAGEDGSSAIESLLFRVRVLDDVEACTSTAPGATPCSHDVGTLLAERVGGPQMISAPRWSTDAGWFYVEDRRGDFYRPHISRMSPVVPLGPGANPEIVVTGSNIWLYEVRSTGLGDALVYGEREATGCRQVRVVPTASCSGGLCTEQLNSLSSRILAYWATVQSVDGSTLALFVAGAKEDRRGRCTSTNDIVSVVDSPASGVQSSTILSGANMPSAK